MSKNRKVKPTAKQIKVFKEYEKGGNLGKAMIKAGYSPNTAKTPQKVTQQEGFRYLVDKQLQELENKRQIALAAFTEEKAQNASLADITNAIEKFSKLQRLLSDKSTSNISVNVKQFQTSDERNKV